MIERIISRGLDAPAKFAPTLAVGFCPTVYSQKKFAPTLGVRKGNARYRRG